MKKTRAKFEEGGCIIAGNINGKSYMCFGPYYECFKYEGEQLICKVPEWNMYSVLPKSGMTFDIEESLRGDFNVENIEIKRVEGKSNVFLNIETGKRFPKNEDRRAGFYEGLLNDLGDIANTFKCSVAIGQERYDNLKIYHFRSQDQNKFNFRLHCLRASVLYGTIFSFDLITKLVSTGIPVASQVLGLLNSVSALPTACSDITNERFARLCFTGGETPDDVAVFNQLVFLYDEDKAPSIVNEKLAVQVSRLRDFYTNVLRNKKDNPLIFDPDLKWAKQINTVTKLNAFIDSHVQHQNLGAIQEVLSTTENANRISPIALVVFNFISFSQVSGSTLNYKYNKFSRANPNVTTVSVLIGLLLLGLVFAQYLPGVAFAMEMFSTLMTIIIGSAQVLDANISVVSKLVIAIGAVASVAPNSIVGLIKRTLPGGVGAYIPDFGAIGINSTEKVVLAVGGATTFLSKIVSKTNEIVIPTTDAQQEDTEPKLVHKHYW